MRRLLLSLFFSTLLPAQTSPELPPRKPLEVPARIGIVGEARITLDEVVQRVLENDRDLAISRLVVQ